MEKPKPRLEPETQTLSPSSSGRRSNDSNSPEFEFWRIKNPSFPQPHLLSADELFVDGVLLPLHLLPHPSNPPDSESKPNSNSATPNPEPDSEPGPAPESSTVTPQIPAISPTSKRWKDIFKMGDKKSTTTTPSTKNHNDKDREKKKERKNGSGASSAELNINLWPFSRSHSAGNSGSRPKMAVGSAATRKVSSAPCSRSNSAGESKSRKWPSSPSRGGVHLGRNSPVWQVRRGGSGVRGSVPVVRSAENGVRKNGTESRRSKIGGGGDAGAKARVLNLNVPMCIGYRQHLSCRSDENSAIGGGGDSSSGAQSSSNGESGSSRGALVKAERRERGRDCLVNKKERGGSISLLERVVMGWSEDMGWGRCWWRKRRKIKRLRDGTEVGDSGHSTGGVVVRRCCPVGDGGAGQSGARMGVVVSRITSVGGGGAIGADGDGSKG
ncbi:hypothetical protein HHK36_023903 [Tetracentron sinense]|uniref:Uncharacterized protein n=1 Tax=Tetracentron sinense TaxID=13715 RepID=A0A834YTA9_TETSI|nr:hypothetical protein HHK36_023903 [Tetracentron sinense]